MPIFAYSRQVKMDTVTSGKPEKWLFVELFPHPSRMSLPCNHSADPVPLKRHSSLPCVVWYFLTIKNHPKSEPMSQYFTVGASEIDSCWLSVTGGARINV